MKILVTGANGQLGKCFADLTAGPDGAGEKWHLLGREHFAIDQYAMVEEVLKELKPDWVINAAAYTAVDKAESEPAVAMLMNGEAVGHLAAVCARLNIGLVHVSTDYVFDGRGTRPYLPTDAVGPTGVYGKSKLSGEQLVQHHHPGAFIVRTSWVYSQHGHNFVKTMLRLMADRTELNVVNDQVGCPTYAPDLAAALLQVCRTATAAPGVYHFCNSGAISWFQFATSIAAMIGSDCQVKPIATSQYPTPAARPPYSVLDTSSFSQTFHWPMQPWQDRLRVCLHHLGY
ncbi:MAG: dTDP-4-dehydrorhamnose reductase [Chitinophagaceae bacterium]|jgi:dTDP-4-dehydrorhamnose reductase|nr:dTDP-4-dehydrorhamnose reductase [Chitinophagaceae bacterium]